MNEFAILKSANNIEVTYSRKCLSVNKDNGSHKTISANCSFPELSPNKKAMAYIAPFEWEEVGKLYIYNFITKVTHILTSDKLPDLYTVKKVGWANDEKILLIIGYAFGTFTVGGDFYIYDISNNLLSLIYHEDNCEVTDFNVQTDEIKLNINRFDKENNIYILKTKPIQIKSL